MSNGTDIEWTEATLNPTTGCDKVSEECKNCYMMRLAKRLKAMRQPNYQNGTELTLHPKVLELPMQWKKPKKIFVNSMSDLFHKDVPDDFIQRTFTMMNTANWHTYQILTKRSERLARISPQLPWNKNIWMGVSVGNDKFKFRIDHLRATGAHVKFLSLEPLLGALPNLELTGINWVIVGGESGPGARPMDPNWVRDLRDQCIAANVPFFFKQWGGTRKKQVGRILDGRTWDEFPPTQSNATLQWA